MDRRKLDIIPLMPRNHTYTVKGHEVPWTSIVRVQVGECGWCESVETGQLVITRRNQRVNFLGMKN